MTPYLHKLDNIYEQLWYELKKQINMNETDKLEVHI